MRFMAGCSWPTVQRSPGSPRAQFPAHRYQLGSRYFLVFLSWKFQSRQQWCQILAPVFSGQLPPATLAALLPQVVDVPPRRGAEQAAVFTAELRRALISDLERRTRGIDAIRQHQPACFVEAQPFLKLKRTHGRQGAEMMVEPRWAHLHMGGKLLDTQRLGEIELQPFDGARDTLVLAAGRSHLPQPCALFA